MTIKEKRDECKKKGLVYDTKTKRCRKSKRIKKSKSPKKSRKKKMTIKKKRDKLIKNQLIAYANNKPE